MGLPSASISQARTVEIWSWQNGPDNAVRTFLSLDRIESGDLNDVPVPEHHPLPQYWRELAGRVEHSGTIVVWSDLDHQRLTWKSAKPTLSNTEDIVGRVYRRFLASDELLIRLCAVEDDSNQPFFDEQVAVNDPLYLTSISSTPAPFNRTAMFTAVWDEYSYPIKYEGTEYQIQLRFSVADQRTVDEASKHGISDRGRTKYGKHAKDNIGVSVMRARREITLDTSWCIGYDPRERWWGAEIEFPPELDELFGLTNNKQAVNHFSALAASDWRDLALEGEEHHDVIRRLKADDDPRGWLLDLALEIRRNLVQLRDLVKDQGMSRRTSRGTRHKPDAPVAKVNRKWKGRSEVTPLPDEKKEPTSADLDEIRDDLTKNKRYSEDDAEQLVTLIKNEKLQVVFLEQDFPNSYELFNVDIKGSVTEVIFNRKHAAFADIFGTIVTVDKDVEELSVQEVAQALMRAVDASKITFAAWARYEREVGLRKIEQLRKVRFDWGRMAAEFLEDDDDSDGENEGLS